MQFPFAELELDNALYHLTCDWLILRKHWRIITKAQWSLSETRELFLVTANATGSTFVPEEIAAIVTEATAQVVAVAIREALCEAGFAYQLLRGLDRDHHLSL